MGVTSTKSGRLEVNLSLSGKRKSLKHISTIAYYVIVEPISLIHVIGIVIQHICLRQTKGKSWLVTSKQKCTLLSSIVVALLD